MKQNTSTTQDINGNIRTDIHRKVYRTVYAQEHELASTADSMNSKYFKMFSLLEQLAVAFS